MLSRATFAIGWVLIASTAYAQAGACPSQEFTTFLDAYSESDDLQKQFTRFPLAVSFVTEARAIAQEPLTVSSAITAANAVYPLLPSAETQKKQELVRAIEEKGTARVVHYTKPDTDYRFDAHFVKTRGCWQMIEKYDASL